MAELTAQARKRLEKSGHLDPDTGAMRGTVARRCERCKRPIWRGIDADFGGLSRDCDPEPLTVAGEIAALMAGRRTFDLRRLGTRYVLDTRDHWRISASPAGSFGSDVLVEHEHVPHGYPTGPSGIPALPTVVELGDVPPF